jgi:hypothetical protein
MVMRIYVCYEEKEKSWFVLERVKFNDDRGCSKIQSILCSYFVFKKERQWDFMVIYKGWDEIHKRISGFVIMHPMVTRDQIYQKSNGHTV